MERLDVSPPRERQPLGGLIENTLNSEKKNVKSVSKTKNSAFSFRSSAVGEGASTGLEAILLTNNVNDATPKKRRTKEIPSMSSPSVQYDVNSGTPPRGSYTLKSASPVPMQRPPQQPFRVADASPLKRNAPTAFTVNSPVRERTDAPSTQSHTASVSSEFTSSSSLRWSTNNNNSFLNLSQRPSIEGLMERLHIIENKISSVSGSGSSSASASASASVFNFEIPMPTSAPKSSGDNNTDTNISSSNRENSNTPNKPKIGSENAHKAVADILSPSTYPDREDLAMRMSAASNSAMKTLLRSYRHPSSRSEETQTYFDTYSPRLQPLGQKEHKSGKYVVALTELSSLQDKLVSWRNTYGMNVDVQESETMNENAVEKEKTETIEKS